MPALSFTFDVLTDIQPVVTDPIMPYFMMNDLGGMFASIFYFVLVTFVSFAQTILSKSVFICFQLFFLSFKVNPNT